MRITIKIGSNVLTRADGTLHTTRMSSLVDQIAQLRREGHEIILVTSGAVACGRSELRHITRDLDSVDQRQLFAAVGQAKLIDRYYQLLREWGITVGQLLTTKENFADASHRQNQENCLRVMLAEGVLPIVNENDVVSITELMFTDNDELSGLMARMTHSALLIILSNIDGLYTGAPCDPASRLIPRVAPATAVGDYIQASRSSAGRGGMASKAGVAQRLAAEGLPVIIANGTRPDILLRLMHDRASTPCTLFEAARV